MFHKIKFICIFLWILIAATCVFVTFSVDGSLILKQHHIETDLLKFVAQGSNDKQIETQVTERLSKKVVLLAQVTNTQSIMHHYQEILDSVPDNLFVDIKNNNQAQATYKLFFDHRYHLLSNKDRQALLSGDNQAFISQLNYKLYSLDAVALSSSIERDPFDLTKKYLASLSSSMGNGKALQFENNIPFLELADKRYVVLNFVLQGNPFEEKTQKLFLNFYNGIKQLDEANELLGAGAIFHSIAGYQSAKHEISVFGVLSFIGIIGLILFVFRSLVPLFLCLLSVGSGMWFGFSASILMFGSIHIFTILFGLSIIGISIDYAFHYLVHFWSFNNNQQAHKSVFLGISIGLLTTLFSYSVFALTGMPGLQQVAVFSSFGLLAAYITVNAVLVLLPPRTQTRAAFPNPFLVSLLNRWHDLLVFGKSGFYLISFALVIIVISAYKLNVDDNIKLLGYTDPIVKAQQQAIEKSMSVDAGQMMFMVKADDVDQALDKVDQLQQLVLDKLVQEQMITSYQTVSSSLPSKSMQQQNYQLIAQQLIGSSGFSEFLQHVGFNQQTISNIESIFTDQQGHYLTIDKIMQSPLSSNLGDKIYYHDNQVYLLNSLHGVTDSRQVTERLHKEGVVVLDLADKISEGLTQTREVVLLALAIAYTVLLLLFSLRYNFKRAICITGLPVFCAIFAAAMCNLIGGPVNLFVVLACFLIVGIGIDYTIFLSESKSDVNLTLLAVFMSAITTVLSFGLLSLSQTPLIHLFGFTFLSGISLMALLAPVIVKFADFSKDT